MPRRLIGIVVALLVIAALVAVGVEIVLHSDLPRRMVADALEDQLDLRVQIADFETGWLGRSAVQGVTLTLPLEDDPIVTLDQMRLSHAALWSLLLTRNLDVGSVVIDGGALHVREQEGGRWNVQDLLDRLDGDGDEGGGTPDLPHVKVTDFEMQVTPIDGDALRVGPVQFEGTPTGGGGWNITAAAPGMLEVSGRIAAGNDWPHRIELTGEGLDRLAKPWVNDPPQPAKLDLAWTGRVRDGVVNGRLELREAQLGPASARGTVEVDVQGAAATLRPRGFVVEHPALPGGARLSDGSIELSTDAIRADELQLLALNTQVNLDAQWSLAPRGPQIGTVSGSWSGAVVTPAIVHQGRFEVALARPVPGQHQLDLRIHPTVKTPWGILHAEATVTGRGETLAGADWRAQVPHAVWRQGDQAPVILDGLQFRVATVDSKVVLRDLALRGAGRLTGSAEYDLEAKQWQAQLELMDWPVRRLGGHGVDLAIDASGSGRHADVRTLSAEVDGLTVQASGSYERGVEQEVDFEVTVGYSLAALGRGGGQAQPAADAAGSAGDGAVPEAPASEAASAARDAAAESDIQLDAGDAAAPAGAAAAPAERAARRWAGELTWQGRITGQVTPIKLNATGSLDTQSLVINHEPVENVTVPMELSLIDKTLVLQSEGFSAFGGDAVVEANADLNRMMAAVRLQFEQVPLARAAPLIDRELVPQGTMSGDITASIPLDTPGDFNLEGGWSAHQVHEGLVAIEQASGRIHLHHKLLRLQPIELYAETSAEGEAPGKITGRILCDLDEKRFLRADLVADRWPLVLLNGPQISAVTTGQVRAVIDRFEHTVTGDVNLSGVTTHAGEAMGAFEVEGELREQLLHLDRVRARILGGELAGEATVYFDAPETSFGQFQWHGLDLGQLAQWGVPPEQARGHLAGELSFGPATADRPLEPMQFQAHVDARDAMLRGVPFGNLDFSGFAGKRRVLLQESDFAVADGSASLWASFTKQPQNPPQQWYGHVELDFERLDVALLNRGFESVEPPDEELIESEDAAPMQGRLSGEIRALGPIGGWEKLVGRGTVTIAESDLAEMDIIGGLFRVMGVGLRKPEPDGEGLVRLRFEGGSLLIDRFEYFNRGVDMVGDGSIQAVHLGMDSPISAYVIGTIRPFKTWKLPGAAFLDKLLASMQAAVTAVRVSGTVARHDIQQVSLTEVTATLGELLFGGGDNEIAGEVQEEP